MKKIMIIMLLSFAAYFSQGQTAFSHTTSNPTGAILNTSIDTMTYSLAKGYRLVTIQPVITRATGTMAGTSILAYSAYSTSGPWVNTDTLTNTNAATNTAVWNKTSAARYWRIITSGATTVTGTTAAKIVIGN